MGAVFERLENSNPVEEITTETNLTLSNGDDISAGVSLRYGSKLWRVEVRYFCEIFERTIPS